MCATAQPKIVGCLNRLHKWSVRRGRNVRFLAPVGELVGWHASCSIVGKVEDLAKEGDAMTIRRKKVPLVPARKPERGREVELELPVPSPAEKPGMKRQDNEVERGEIVIDMFESDDQFVI